MTRLIAPAAVRAWPTLQQQERESGFAGNTIWIADDFDAPLPEDMLEEFER